ncbi:MAG: hypothetical protein SH856_01870 [Flavobacteriales bacterium]|nr:hypothetical protein [Flavobacteriales bacterium]
MKSILGLDSEQFTGTLWEWTRNGQKIAVLIVAFLSGAFSSSAQLPGIGEVVKNGEVQIEYLDQNRVVQSGTNGAWFTRTSEIDVAMLYHVEIHEVSSGELVMSGSYSDASLTTEEGLFRYFFAVGTPESEGHYQSGMKTGEWKRWEFTGIAKLDRLYPVSCSSYSEYASKN